MSNQQEPSFLFNRTDQYATEDSIYRMHMMGKLPQEIANELSVDILFVQNVIKKNFN